MSEAEVEQLMSADREGHEHAKRNSRAVQYVFLIVSAIAVVWILSKGSSDPSVDDYGGPSMDGSNQTGFETSADQDQRSRDKGGSNSSSETKSSGAANVSDGRAPSGSGQVMPLPKTPLRIREELGSLMEQRGAKVGVEIGVQRGIFSNSILSAWKSCERFYLVDVWRHQDNYEDTANVNDTAQEENMEFAKSLLHRFENITVFLRMLSTEAAHEIADNSLDFVFVDARHDYCGVTADLKSYWPKLRVGGILAGHDYKYVDGGQDWGLCQNGSRVYGSVRKAVEDFIPGKVDPKDVKVTRGYPSFYMVKVHP